MTRKLKASLSITLLFVHCVAYVQASCTVCVMLNLVSTPYKCPPCDESGQSDEPSNTNNTDNGSSSKECEEQPHDWTTCFVSAKTCDKTYKYRSLDGSCNNLKHPTWGMASTAMVRIRPAWYADGKHKMIKSANGYARPSPRIITNALFGQDDIPDNLSLSAMVWGQPPAHDGAISVSKSQDTPYCCDKKTRKDQDLCMPIKIPKNDVFYSKHIVTCISEIRTNTTYTGYCNTNGPADQINGNSALIDLNIVYGTDDSLRAFKNGQLRVQTKKTGHCKYSYPPNDKVSENCYLGSPSEPCYITGDVRADLNTEHTIIQVGLLRMHNLIAGRFADLNPDWDEETVFQEARTVNIAIFQHITFNEWLGHFVGSKYMEKYKLYSLKEGFTKYNSCLPLMTTNVFTTAGFRVFHSAIQGHLRMSNNYTSIYDYQPIGRWMARPVIIQEDNNLDKFFIGMLTQPMLKIDEHYNDQVRNNMFEGFDTYGKDLVGLDIQRGRDHGLDCYVNYLEIFTGYKVTKWDDLYAVISKENVDKLKNLYGDVRNIDAVVGMILENKVPGTRLGPTSLKIILDQFVRWKYGDRFWFEHGGFPHSFTPEQLEEIRNMTFSKFVCLISNNVTHVPRRGFELPSKKNPIVECNELAGLDFSKWKK